MKRYDLRLMPQPIHQYVIDEGKESHKGVIFVFAYGTNPEVLLLIEPLDDGWQYGIARMTGAEATVKLDDRVVWTKPRMAKVGRSWLLDYIGERHLSDLPQRRTDE